MRLFYIDSFNIVQEAVKSNTSNNWVNGSLGASNWQASGSSSGALAACNNYQFYNATGNGGGVRLFYGVDNNTVRELIYSFGTQEWTGDHSIAGADGDGGLACAGLNNAVTYLWFLNQQNQLEYCWYHFDSSLLNDPNHPPNTWVQDMYRPMSLLTPRSSRRLEIDDFDNPPQAQPPTPRCAPSRRSVCTPTSIFKTHPTILSASHSRKRQRILLGKAYLASVGAWKPYPGPEWRQPRSMRPRTRRTSGTSSFRIMAATSWSTWGPRTAGCGMLIAC